MPPRLAHVLVRLRRTALSARKLSADRDVLREKEAQISYEGRKLIREKWALKGQVQDVEDKLVINSDAAADLEFELMDNEFAMNLEKLAYQRIQEEMKEV